MNRVDNTIMQSSLNVSWGQFWMMPEMEKVWHVPVSRSTMKMQLKQMIFHPQNLLFLILIWDVGYWISLTHGLNDILREVICVNICFIKFYTRSKISPTHFVFNLEKPLHVGQLGKN